MYLWKYWRESRITFASSFAVALLLCALIFIDIFPDPTFMRSPALIVPLIFLAWRFGSFGIGRDLDDNCGSYLFTRPRSHSFFVWRDWGFGLAQLTVIAIALNVLIALAGQMQNAAEHHTNPTPSSLSLPAVIALNCVTDLLIVALVFGTTYLCTVLLKLKGLIFAAGILLSYPLCVVLIVKHYWPTVHLPNLILTAFIRSANGTITHLADHLALSIAARAAIPLLFPFAAILLLQRRDVE
ncbi:MAG: hypothetical protein WBY53_06495 [Acidobacteriaceae bacterium]